MDDEGNKTWSTFIRLLSRAINKMIKIKDKQQELAGDGKIADTEERSSDGWNSHK